MRKNKNSKYIFSEERYTGRVSKSEHDVLDTLIKMQNGHAYSVWKVSGLKHYPTVLRALQKLERKGFVEIQVKRGVRNEKIYAPTLAGIVVPNLLKRDEKKLVEILAKKFSKFRELINAKTEKMMPFVAINVGRQIALKARTEKKKIDDKSINRILENVTFDYFIDKIINPDQEVINKAIGIKEVKWARDVVIKIIDDEKNRIAHELSELSKLEKILMQND